MKISYLRKIELRCIRTTLTTAAYIDGFTQEIGDQSEISNLRRLFSTDLLEMIYLQPVCWVLV